MHPTKTCRYNLLDVLGEHAKEEETVEGMQGADDHDHEHGSGEPSEEEPEYDEHVWLSLKNAQLFVSAIADSLSQADTAHADAYAANACLQQTIVTVGRRLSIRR